MWLVLLWVWTALLCTVQHQKEEKPASLVLMYLSDALKVVCLWVGPPSQQQGLARRACLIHQSSFFLKRHLSVLKLVGNLRELVSLGVRFSCGDDLILVQASKPFIGRPIKVIQFYFLKCCRCHGYFNASLWVTEGQCLTSSYFWLTVVRSETEYWNCSVLKALKHVYSNV